MLTISAARIASLEGQIPTEEPVLLAARTHTSKSKIGEAEIQPRSDKLPDCGHDKTTPPSQETKASQGADHYDGRGQHQNRKTPEELSHTRGSPLGLTDRA